MNPEFINPMDGPMVDYDFDLMPAAKAVMDYLVIQPSFKWWNNWFFRPKSIKEAIKEKIKENGYSKFRGWDSFVWRNNTHEISKTIYKEFRRVYGRSISLYD